MTQLKLLDGVELRVESGRWPAGVTGTVVEIFDDGLLVEVADDEGRTLDLLPLPHEAVAKLPAPRQERLAVS